MENDPPFWVKLLINVMSFGVPGIFLGFGIWMLVKTRRFMGNANRVSATVVEIGETRTYDAEMVQISYIPTYEYRSMTGGMVQARAFSSTSTRPEIGDQKTMLVNPDEPEVVRFSSIAGYGFAAFGILIGAPALIIVLLYS